MRQRKGRRDYPPMGAGNFLPRIPGMCAATTVEIGYGDEGQRVGRRMRGSLRSSLKMPL